MKYFLTVLASALNSTKNSIKNHKIRWTAGFIATLLTTYFAGPDQLQQGVNDGVIGAYRSTTDFIFGGPDSDGAYHFDDYTFGRNGSEAIQAIYDDIQERGARVNVIEFDGAVVKMDSTVYLPLLDNSARIHHKGEGALIIANNKVDLFAENKALKTMHIGFSGASDNASKYVMQTTWDEFVFRGGKNVLRLVAQRNALVTDCAFENNDRAIVNIWCQNCWAENCEFQFQFIEDIVIRSAVSDQTLMAENGLPYDPINDKYFTNSNTSNSQSNRSGTRNCWFYGRTGQFAQIRVQASDGCQSLNDILEGAPTKYGAYIDSRNSTTTWSYSMINTHIEQGNPAITKALIYAREVKNLYIDRLYSQIADVLVIKTEGNIGQVILDNLNYLPWSNPTFSSDPQIKYVITNSAQPIQNAASFARWEGPMVKEVYWNRGVDMYSLGTQGIALRSRTKINGRDQQSVFRLHGHTINQAGVNYLQRAKKYSVQAKEQWD